MSAGQRRLTAQQVANMIEEESERDVALQDLDIEVNNEEFVVTAVVMGEITNIQVMTSDVTNTPNDYRRLCHS